jgi:NADPH-dependent curcumin reductase
LIIRFSAFAVKSRKAWRCGWARLKDLCPKGIDIFFDNVGGDILEAALARLAMRGRVALCGAIANYNATEPPSGPKNYST